MEEEEMKEMKEVLFKTNMNEVITMIATKRESDNPNLNKFFKFEIYNTINNQFHNILKNHLKEKGKIKRIKRKINNQKLKLERIHGYKYILINNFNSQLIFEYIDKEEQNHDFFIDMVNDLDVIDQSKCVKCGLCAKVCPAKCIKTGEKVEILEKSA